MSAASPASAVVPVLVENHRRFLDFLTRRLPSREVAEDVLQDAFVRGMRKAPPLASAESIVAWFYRVLRNAVVDHYRRAGAEERALDRLTREPVATAEPEDPELYDAVCGCVRSLLTTLKPEYADAITLVDLEGQSLATLARRSGITPNNAGVRLHRAHKALRRRVIETCSTCAEHGCYQCGCQPPVVASRSSASSATAS